MSDNSARYSVNLILPQVSSAGDMQTAQDINYLIFAARELALALDSYTGALSPLKTDWSVLVAGAADFTNPYKVYAYCAAAVNYGAFVKLTNYTATRVQGGYAKADAAGNAAMGFCDTPGGIGAGEYGEFIVGPGINHGISGLTPGSYYWLSPTSASGQIQNTRPTVAGQVDQMVGFALTDTKLVVGSLNNWKVI